MNYPVQRPSSSKHRLDVIPFLKLKLLVVCALLAIYPITGRAEFVSDAADVSFEELHYDDCEGNYNRRWTRTIDINQYDASYISYITISAVASAFVPHASICARIIGANGVPEVWTSSTNESFTSRYMYTRAYVQYSSIRKRSGDGHWIAAVVSTPYETLSNVDLGAGYIAYTAQVQSTVPSSDAQGGFSFELLRDPVQIVAAPAAVEFGQTAHFEFSASYPSGRLVQCLINYWNENDWIDFYLRSNDSVARMSLPDIWISPPSLTLQAAIWSAPGATTMSLQRDWVPDRGPGFYNLAIGVVFTDGKGDWNYDWSSLIVTKATPIWTLNGQIWSSSRTLTLTDLTSAFANLRNPYSSSVAQPTGSVSYAITQSGGPGATPNGPITPGATVLQVGTYTISATYNGDDNYNSVTASATFTVNAYDPNGDNDHDGIPNQWELEHGLNPNDPNDALADPDGDGLTNIAEFNLGSDPHSAQSPANKLLPSIYTTLSSGNQTRTEAVGATAGQFSVDKSGAATYSIPIWVTPGTGGMQPKLSLEYSSRAGSDIAGFGWSLNGTLKISRLPSTLAQDGRVAGVSYTESDRFALDGQRLILISGTYGADGAEYRTEIDSFSRIVSFGQSGNGPARFRVWTKDGLIIDFGNPSDASRSDCTVDAADGQSIRSWHARRISDVSGNYMEFSYLKDTAAGTHLLDQIDYTGNTAAGLTPYASVKFDYEDRPDVFRGYVVGAVSAVTKRLKAVSSKYGATVVHSYTLSYADPATRNTPLRSILASITETGLNGKAYPATTFDYTNPAPGWDILDTARWAPPTIVQELGVIRKGVAFVDVDGDGYPDCVQAKYSYSGGVSTYTHNTWLNRSAGWVLADGLNGQPDYRLPNDVNLAYGAGPFPQFSDINSDGLVDIISQYIAAINTGHGFEIDNEWPFWWPIGSGALTPLRNVVLDINGDGRPDYVYFDVDTQYVDGNPDGSDLRTTVGYNIGRTPNSSPWAQWPFSNQSSIGCYPYDGASSRFIDLDADGLPDQIDLAGVAFPKYGPNNTFYFVNRGANWVPPIPINLGTEIVDLNGDQLPDLVRHYSGSSQIQSDAYVNTGNGWLHAPQLAVAYPFVNNDKPDGTTLIDINNDGFLDLVYASNNARDVRLGTGTGWASSADSAYNLPFPIVVNSTDQTGIQFVDLDADGAVDVIWHFKQGETISSGAAHNRRVNPDRLVKVTNGLGVALNVTYAPLTERSSSDVSTVYDRAAGSVYPVKDVAVPAMYVVKAVSYDSGLDNTDGSHGQYDINYRYAGLREHALRGSLGFASVTITDSRTGIYTKTTYKQEFPYVGNPFHIEVYTPSSTVGGSPILLSQTINTWVEKSLNNGATHFPYIEQSYVKTWDFNGAYVSGITISIPAYDDWGNPLCSSVEVWKENDESDGHQVDTAYVYDNSMRDAPSEGASRWFIGRKTSVKVNASGPIIPGGDSEDFERNSTFEYYDTTGFLKKVITEPGSAANTDGSNLTLTTEYGYDAFGNRGSVTVSGGGMESRDTDVIFDTKGRFPYTTTNALNHTETYVYDQLLGVPKSLTGPNSLTTIWDYDEMGRKRKEWRPCTNPATPNCTEFIYRWCGSSAPSGSVYQIETLVSGTAPSLAVFDRLGRGHYAFVINGGQVGGPFRMVGIRSWYDNFGRAYRTSVPFSCYGGIPTNPAYASHTDYDPLGRPVRIYAADDPASGTMPIYQLTSVDYNGRIITTTNPKRQVSRAVKDAVGQVVESYTNLAGDDTERGLVKYFYDPVGQLRRTATVRATDNSEVVILVGYDSRGRRISMVDPDAGAQAYRYNAIGELISQTDAKNQTASFTYDKLGRPRTRIEPEGTTTWAYDTALRGSAQSWIGKLASVTFVPVINNNHKAYSESYSYDTVGRSSQITRTIDGTGYSQWQTYDDFGRPYITTYPGSSVDVCGYKVKNIYDAYGFLREVRDARTSGSLYGNDVPAGYLYWKADGYSLTGAVNASTLGNGATLDRVISDITGRTFAITSGKGCANDIQNVIYNFDPVGNVTRRQNSAQGTDEMFEYDVLNRLTRSDLNRAQVINVAYDCLGNIVSKSNAGTTYSYGENGYGPHAVTHVSGGNLGDRRYYYDLNGNLTTETIGGISQRTQTWTSYNQIKTIAMRSGRSTEFWFGANHERVLQQDNDGTKTVYIGSAMEIVSKGGLIERKCYIFTPAGRVAVRTERNDSTPVETRFLHQDALGSVTAVTDEFGNVEQRFAFDAWGLRCQPVNARSRAGGVMTRGYTDHEQLDAFGLIHMNGRVYDPTLSRFLSADAFVQNPFDNQTFNRYSYVGNNPTRWTDPTGLLSDEAWEAFAEFWADCSGPAPSVTRVTQDCTGGSISEFFENLGSNHTASTGSTRIGTGHLYVKDLPAGEILPDGRVARVIIPEGKFIGYEDSLNCIEGTLGRIDSFSSCSPGQNENTKIPDPNSVTTNPGVSLGLVAPGVLPKNTPFVSPAKPGTVTGAAGSTWITRVFGMFAIFMTPTTMGNSEAPANLRPDTAKTFRHYGYAADAPKFAGGLYPGAFATNPSPVMSGPVAQQQLALPHDPPPDSSYIVIVPNEWPVVGPMQVQPTENPSRTGGGTEYQFPVGTPPGTVFGPFPLPTK